MIIIVKNKYIIIFKYFITKKKKTYYIWGGYRRPRHWWSWTRWTGNTMILNWREIEIGFPIY